MQLTETITVAEIAATSLAAVRIFEKYGIDYCCGGKRPLDEVCREKGHNTDTVQRELDAALAGAPAPPVDWNTASLNSLIHHIVSTHHEYLRTELPAIQIRLDKVYRVYNQRYGPTLTGLPEIYAALRSELEMHIRKEETILLWAGHMLFEIERNGSLTKFEMKPGDRIHVAPKTVHRMTALQDCDIFEVSTPELDDVVRLEDRYGREDAPRT